jgi:UDP-perosamine 4-acetyltransferase
MDVQFLDTVENGESLIPFIRWLDRTNSMSIDRPVIVLGGGGHARVLLDLLGLLGATILGVTTFDGMGEAPMPGVSVLGDDDAVLRFSPGEIMLVNALGIALASDKRKKLQEKFLSAGYVFPALLHPAAIVSRFAVIGDGCQVMAGAVVQAGARIGTGAVINTRATVDHDCEIGPYAHIAPGASLSGAVRVGECTLIGTGASVIQGITIGAMCTVGAGSAVIRELRESTRYAGVPARPLKPSIKSG